MHDANHHIAHFNIARLRAAPGDPLVAEFVDNVPKVNAVAERSPGFVWRWKDETARVDGLTYEAVTEDPLLAISISVWERVVDFENFVRKTVHGSFLRRRQSWFEQSVGPNYVIWAVAQGHVPTVAEGLERLAELAGNGPTEQAFDLAYAAAMELRS